MWNIKSSFPDNVRSTADNVLPLHMFSSLNGKPHKSRGEEMNIHVHGCELLTAIKLNRSLCQSD